MNYAHEHEKNTKLHEYKHVDDFSYEREYITDCAHLRHKLHVESQSLKPSGRSLIFFGQEV
jgi:hypothetical protein